MNLEKYRNIKRKILVVGSSNVEKYGNCQARVPFKPGVKIDVDDIISTGNGVIVKINNNNYFIECNGDTMPAGGGVNIAFGLKQLNANIVFITPIGNDIEGETVKKFCYENGIDFKSLPRPKTAITICIKIDGVSTLLCLKPKYQITGQSISSKIETNRVIAGGIRPADTPLVKEAFSRTVGLKFICPNPKLFEHPKGFALVSKADFVQMNKFEAKKVSGLEKVDHCAKYLISKGVKNLIVTLEAEGSILYNGNKKYCCKAFREPGKIIDRTGAGDGYLTTFAYIIKNDFSNIEEAMEIASIVASIIVTRKGGATMPDWQTIIEHYKNIKQQQIKNRGVS